MGMLAMNSPSLSRFLRVSWVAVAVLGLIEAYLEYRNLRANLKWFRIGTALLGAGLIALYWVFRR
jgi:hypothetical protein